MYMATEAGAPTAFVEVDALNAPANVVSWSMAVGASDVLHVVWTERSSWNVPAGSWSRDQRLRYSQFDTVAQSWGAVEDVDTNLDVQEVGQGDELCAIAVDGDGTPHVVYLKSDGTRRRVAYARRAGPDAWTDPTGVPGGYVDDQPFSMNHKSWHPGIVFDQSGRIVVSWMRGGWEGETYARPLCPGL